MKNGFVLYVVMFTRERIRRRNVLSAAFPLPSLKSRRLTSWLGPASMR